MAGHRRYASAPQVQPQQSKKKSSMPPLAPLIFFVGLLGPMHLSTSMNAVPEEPKFLSRADFQRRRTAKTSKPPTVFDPNRHYQHSDFGGKVSEEEFETIYERNATKLSFDLLDHPVFPSNTSSAPTKRLKVLFLTQKLGAGKVQHVFLDGLRRSDYLELVDVVALPSNESYRDRGEDVWMDDSPISGCEHTEAYAQQSHRKTIPIVHLDYKDFPYMAFCKKLHEYVGGKHNIRYVKRSIVDHRLFNWTAGWTDAGYYRPNIGWEGSGGPIIHSPYGVRTDQVKVMQRALLSTNFTSPVDYEPRPIDAMHFWGKGNDPVSHLRNHVTDIVKGLNGHLIYNETKEDGSKVAPIPNNRIFRTVARIVGNRGTKGRRSVQEDYVKSMLKSKIVVVTQRDKWEGHYRLMEALMGGAMVAHDFMLSLPKGLVDRESVVLFRSRDELEESIRYYSTHEDERKAIAQRGWEVAMGRHRSWHRMEEIFFGRPLTDVNNPYGPYKKDLQLEPATE